MATILTYVFLSQSIKSLIKRIVFSTTPDFSRSAGLKTIPSSFQVVGIYWVVIGVLINGVGESWPKGTVGNIILLILVGFPILVGSIIVEKLKSKNGRKH